MLSNTTPEKLINPTTSDTSWINKTIPFMGGRPRRDSPIMGDDIVNLIIACNTSGSLEEFLLQT